MDGDSSVMTYRGHRIQKSLIRARFSPSFTTGQRYIYTGCGTGRLISKSTTSENIVQSIYYYFVLITVYDVLTGKIVQAIEGHNDITRDVAWHPYRSEILTSSWDFTINMNAFRDPDTAKERYESVNDDDDDDEDEEEDHRRKYDGDRRTRGGGPLRRSQRIAQQRNRSALD